jgi:NADP-dependent aldehyde dehydrogenase
MNLHGKNFIDGGLSSEGAGRFAGVNPVTGADLEPRFAEASAAEIDRALATAKEAFETYQRQSSERIAQFLERIGEEIAALGDELIQRANVETALPEARLTGERARTINQLKMFSDLVREGSWVEASIDRAIPDRKPVPKPDLRRMLVPIGPVVVFGASNFPLAFSVAGGDTASALAAGNPVVFKAHPAHPGTSELVARAIVAAAEKSQMPASVFSLLHGTSHSLGMQLVRHPAAKAVGFTGSLKAGRSLFDAAAARPEPIPVYAEMGSTNPVFVLPGALKQNGAAIAEGLVQSVTLGVGQFCTNPGLVFGRGDSAFNAFIDTAAKAAAGAAPGTMLYRGVCERFEHGLAQARAVSGVKIAGQSGAPARPGQAAAILFATNAATFLANDVLQEELFGPSTLIVSCSSTEELEQAARNLPGQLTATVHGTEEDLAAHRGLLAILKEKVGRIIFNGFPTGVEVCPSMHHGGPYPATTHSHFTSVGTAAIKRFTRPLCFQNFPQTTLPAELQNRNARNIWRLVDGKVTKEDVSGK